MLAHGTRVSLTQTSSRRQPARRRPSFLTRAFRLGANVIPRPRTVYAHRTMQRGMKMWSQGHEYLCSSTAVSTRIPISWRNQGVDALGRLCDSITPCHKQSAASLVRLSGTNSLIQSHRMRSRPHTSKGVFGRKPRRKPFGWSLLSNLTSMEPLIRGTLREHLVHYTEAFAERRCHAEVMWLAIVINVPKPEQVVGVITFAMATANGV